MKAIITFWKASIESLFLTPSGGLSLPKVLALTTSAIATYKFIIMESNEPLIWLIYLGVIGGHGLAAKLASVVFGSKENSSKESE